MTAAELVASIDDAWERRESISTATTGPVRDAIESSLDALDRGDMRVAEKRGDSWHVNEWLKKAVLLSFRLNDMMTIAGGPGSATAWFDKVASKFAGWNDARFREAGFRAVPSCVVRHSAYIAPGVVLMPSFVNLGAYVDSGTMIDTWATVGSCAQIGKNCHISGRCGDWRRPRTLAGEPGNHRRQLLRRRSIRGRGRRHRRTGISAGDGASISAPRPGSSTERPARSISVACRPTPS